ncbi:hypothetical protein [Fodinicola acaciae]|uniref:hypothetical protein n=1 Tax=Fodinicola acaciae TaxID=2681555 RepID=UPI0013D37144|nr:hypothetical protein [Fodinicola acaciae]
MAQPAVAEVVSLRLPAALRRQAPLVAAEIAAHLAERMPECWRAPRSIGVRQQVIEKALSGFIDRLENPAVRRAEDVFWLRHFGSEQARDGFSLETVHNAFLAGAWIGWRHLSGECQRLGLSGAALCELSDAAYRYANELFTITAQGYRAITAPAGRELPAFRRTLLRQLLAPSPPDADVLLALAAAAQWPLPAEISVVLVEGDEFDPGHSSLFDDESTPARLITAEPRALSRLASKGKIRRIVVGPLLPVTAARESWAAAIRALELTDRGVLADQPVIWCDLHPLLRRTSTDRSPTPLGALSERQRARLCETLVPWVTEPVHRPTDHSGHSHHAAPAALGANHPLYALRIAEKRMPGLG